MIALSDNVAGINRYKCHIHFRFNLFALWTRWECFAIPIRLFLQGQALAVSPQTSPRVVDSKESESVTHIHAELAEVSKKKVNKHDFVMSDTLRAEMTHLLLESVSRCSRQKMRYILMILRRMGGVDGYMSYSDLSKVLQVRTTYR